MGSRVCKGVSASRQQAVLNIYPVSILRESSKKTFFGARRGVQCFRPIQRILKFPKKEIAGERGIVIIRARFPMARIADVR